jgi:predicted ATP-binding protein involved in virulence
MRLKKITLSNYRCFENLELDLHPRLTVLVGENGSGKTSILDAIASGLSPLFRYLSSADQRLSGPGIKDTDFRIEQLPERGSRQRWGTTDYVQVVVETISGMIWDNWRRSSINKQQASKIGQTKLSDYAKSILESFKTASPEQLPILAYYGAQRGRIEIPERLRPTNQEYSYPTAALVGALDSQSDFKELLKWFDIEESTELRVNKGCRPDEFELSVTLETVRSAIESIFNKKYRNPNFNKDHKFVVEQEDGMALQVSQLSQGYQSMLALVMDFARRLAIGNGHLTFDELLMQQNQQSLFDLELPDNLCSPCTLAPGVMLIDEIDLHLHPSWQQRVIPDLMRTFPNTQFIVTTHSPQVLSTVHRDCIRLLGKNSNGQLVATKPLAESYGEMSSDVLESVMQVNPMPPVPEKVDLDRLTALVDQGLYDEWEAQNLLERLRGVFGDSHPQIQKLLRSIQRQKALKS